VLTQLPPDDDWDDVLPLRQLRRLHIQLLNVMERMNTMSAEIDAALQALGDEVTQVQTVEASAVALLQGLSAQIATLIAEVSTEPATVAKLQDFKTSLDTATQDLAAAVAAGTPPPPAG
jgi:uncharacterized membrane protein YccC